MMLDQRSAHSRMAAATRRRLVALSLARTSRYELRPFAAPGLVTAAPDERSNHRANI